MKVVMYIYYFLLLFLLLFITTHSTNAVMVDEAEVNRPVPPRVVLSVSLSDCFSCISELSMWNELHQNYGNIIQFTLYIRTERRDDISAKFKKEYRFGFDVKQDRNGEIARHLGFPPSPSVRIFDRRGNPIYKRNLGEAVLDYDKEVLLIKKTLDQLSHEIDSIELVKSHAIGPDQIGRLVMTRCPIQFSRSLKNYLMCDDLFNKAYLVDESGKIKKVLTKESFGIKTDEFIQGPLAATSGRSLIAVMMNRFEGAVFNTSYRSIVIVNLISLESPMVISSRDTTSWFAPIVRFNSINDLLYVGLDLSSRLPTNQNVAFIKVISLHNSRSDRDYIETPDSLYYRGYVPAYYCEPRFDVDKDGNLYVVQPISYKISKYDNKLNLIFRFGEKTPNFRMSAPLDHELSFDEETVFFDSSSFFRSILCGEDGLIYQGCTEEGQVIYQVYSAEGQLVFRFRAPHTPSKGQLARADSNSNLFFVVEDEEGFSIKQYRVR